MAIFNDLMADIDRLTARLAKVTKERDALRLQLQKHIDYDIETADSGDCGFYEARDCEPTKSSIALLAKVSQ